MPTTLNTIPLHEHNVLVYRDILNLYKAGFTPRSGNVQSPPLRVSAKSILTDPLMHP